MTVQSMADIRARLNAARGVVSRETVSPQQILRTWPDDLVDRLRMLRKTPGITTAEIATALGKTHNAVRLKLSRLGIIIQERRIRRREAACR